MPRSGRGDSARRHAWRVIAVLVLGALIGAPGGAWVARRLLGPHLSEGLRSPRLSGDPRPEAPSSGDAYNLLLMASDATGTRARRSLDANTDTLLLVRIDDRAKRLEALSIPRDTRVPILGHGIFKVNAANAYDGAMLTRSTVSALLGVPVHHHLLVSLEGVRGIVDALGDVHVTVPRRMKYRDRTGGLKIDFRPGRQKMDGAAVEAYLRFRHDAQGDLGRISRLQSFIEEVLPQVASPGLLLRVGPIWQAIRKQVDTDLSLADVLRLARWLVQLQEPPDVAVLPGTDRMIGGLWYWVADEARARAMSRSRFVQEEPPVSLEQTADGGEEAG